MMQPMDMDSVLRHDFESLRAFRAVLRENHAGIWPPEGKIDVRQLSMFFCTPVPRIHRAMKELTGHARTYFTKEDMMPTEQLDDRSSTQCRIDQLQERVRVLEQQQQESESRLQEVIRDLSKRVAELEADDL